MKWMLDTDTCIALIKRQPRELIKRLQGKGRGDVGISSITLAELRYGVAKSTHRDQNRAELDQFLIPLDLEEFDETAADFYGAVREALDVNRR